MFDFLFLIVIKYYYMTTITIPKELTKEGDLVIIPKRIFAALLEKSREKVTEKDILKWSREAKNLKKIGKLPILRSLRDL